MQFYFGRRCSDFDVHFGRAVPVSNERTGGEFVFSRAWHAFAAPAQLDREGTPEQPQELAQHAAVALGSRSDEAAWHLYAENGEEVVVPFVPRLQSDDLETLKIAAIAGLGLVSLPAYLVREEVLQGRLKRILPDWVTQSDAEVTLLTPSRRGQLPSVRALIDFLVAEFPRIVSGI